MNDPLSKSEEDEKSLVSVIMPFYNASAYLNEAIDSVLSQHHDNIELLLINDGSTDDSEIKARSYSDKRVRYFFQQNQGVSAARNYGLNEMKGIYFCFLDADDVMTRDSIVSRLKKFSEDSLLMFCDGAVHVYDQTLSHMQRTWTPKTRGHVFNKLVSMEDTCFFGPTWLIKRIPDMMYRLETDMTHAEDLYFYSMLSIHGKYDFVQNPILKYRKNSSSAMNNFVGLARGYSLYRKKINLVFGASLSLSVKLCLAFRIKKIMFLTFLSNGDFKNAVRFLITNNAI